MVTAKAPTPMASMRRSNMVDIDPKARCRRSNDAASLEKAPDPYKIETELRLTAYKIRKECRAAPRGRPQPKANFAACASAQSAVKAAASSQWLSGPPLQRSRCRKAITIEVRTLT